jgi:hypothetical protein
MDAYVYSHGEARAASFIPVVGLLAGGSDGKVTTVTFDFTPDGVLKDWASTSGAISVNTGLLNQH